MVWMDEDSSLEAWRPNESREELAGSRGGTGGTPWTTLEADEVSTAAVLQLPSEEFWLVGSETDGPKESFAWVTRSVGMELGWAWESDLACPDWYIGLEGKLVVLLGVEAVDKLRGVTTPHGLGKVFKLLLLSEVCRNTKQSWANSKHCVQQIHKYFLEIGALSENFIDRDSSLLVKICLINFGSTYAVPANNQMKK